MGKRERETEREREKEQRYMVEKRIRKFNNLAGS